MREPERIDRLRKNNLAKERIGTVRKNKYGSLMEVVEYKDVHNILVKFEKGEPVIATWVQFCKGGLRSAYDKSIYGIGYLGEGEFSAYINNKATHQYVTWKGMLERCYNEKALIKNPTYRDCFVTEEWHNFQNFAKWYEENFYEIDGERMNNDKDILMKGNKIYSPETCVFVPVKINNLFVKADSKRGNLPIGVGWAKRQNKYYARCNNGEGKQFTLSYHSTLEEAFLAYKTFKEKIIKQVAEKYKNRIPEKLYNALINYTVEISD